MRTQADLVIEAADPIEFGSLDLLIRNQILFGSVNASPEAFRLALEDLRRFDPPSNPSNAPRSSTAEQATPRAPREGGERVPSRPW